MIQTAIGKVNDLEQNQPLCGNMREYRAGPRTPRLFKPMCDSHGRPVHISNADHCHCGRIIHRGEHLECDQCRKRDKQESDKCLSTKGGIGSLSSAEQKSTNSITGTNTTNLQPKDQHGPECGQSDLKTSVSLQQEFKVGDLVECLPDKRISILENMRGVMKIARMYLTSEDESEQAVEFENGYAYYASSLRHYKTENFETEPQAQDGWATKDAEYGTHCDYERAGVSVTHSIKAGCWFAWKRPTVSGGVFCGLSEVGEFKEGDSTSFSFPDWPTCKASIEKATK